MMEVAEPISRRRSRTGADAVAERALWENPNIMVAEERGRDERATSLADGRRQARSSN